MASSDRKTAWLVYGTIVFAGLLIVFLNFGTDQLSSSPNRSEKNIDREALAKIAPAMSDKGYHLRYESEDQCIICHTQGVMGASNMPHDPRERCAECHTIKES